MADGTSSAMVARNSRLAWKRALTGLNSWTWCFSPPSRNDAPTMKRLLATIAPATDALTSTYSPARSAVTAMTSSVNVPSVAFRSPPTASPVFAATQDVASLRSAASGTMASTENTNSSVCASGRRRSPARTAGTKISSHSSGLWRRAASKAAMIAARGSLNEDATTQRPTVVRRIAVRLCEFGTAAPARQRYHVRGVMTGSDTTGHWIRLGRDLTGALQIVYVWAEIRALGGGSSLTCRLALF